MKYSVLLIISLGLCLSLFSCNKTSEESINLNDETVLAYGTEGIINGSTKLTWTSVADLRCPKDVNCVSPGNVDVTFDVNEGGQTTKFSLGLLNSVFPANDTINGYVYTLVNVTPEPDSKNTPKTKDYEVSIVVSQ